MPHGEIIPKSTSPKMEGLFGLLPDRRTKRMPQSFQAPLPLVIHSSRIALHCIAAHSLGSNAAY